MSKESMKLGLILLSTLDSKVAFKDPLVVFNFAILDEVVPSYDVKFPATIK